MEAPGHLPEPDGSDIARTSKRTTRLLGRARIVLAAAAVLALGACGFAAPVQDPPEDPVPYDEVVGLWENGHGETIEFHEDGILTADPSTFSERTYGNAPEGPVEGTWLLCKSIYGEAADGSKHRSPTCVESDQGEYLSIDTEQGGVGGSLLFTDKDSQLQLYPYALEDPTFSEDYYTKID
ncbi:hypothetical protein O1R50_05630 [Glycomyces luteolus]|uniref:Uncharacterized protein n=1 Tax=Glycomyces luteolus TaxID=2670330 RepID=A0A9X3P8V4_9ACTN|nr:hypothetical protein [Glycomyces luteolus]MDA1359093.1 hypothetical protein [Glycomyces luteolus]